MNNQVENTESAEASLQNNGKSKLMASDSESVNSKTISDRSRLIALLLCWFLGAFSIHRFYAGKMGSAVCQILFGWLTLFIWNFVDLVMIIFGEFKDVDGLPIRDWSVK